MSWPLPPASWPPFRWRLTLVFGAAMAVLLAGIGAGLYAAVAGSLLDEVDTGLRSRAATLRADLATLPAAAVPRLDGSAAGLEEPGEAISQLVATDGRVLASSRPGEGALLPGRALAAVSGPAFSTQRVPGLTGETRLLAVPGRLAGDRVLIVVGASLQDRADALHQLAAYLLVGEPVALLLASLAGWLVTGSALRPVERMRRQAAAISVSGLDHRLTVPRGDDEIGRLGRTLNQMLDRLHASFTAERRFLDHASHELRTPLTALKIELDLALSRPRGPDENRAALASAAEETDRLVRLAEDLLVLSRAHHGRLAVDRTDTDVAALLAAAGRTFAARAEASGTRLVVDPAPDGAEGRVAVWAPVDPVRLRQAVDNLVDNALRHTPSGGTVRIGAARAGTDLTITVDDDGPGFPTDRPADGRPDGGLGLAIVRIIAAGHGGTLVTGNRPGGGGRAVLTVAAGTAATGG